MMCPEKLASEVSGLSGTVSSSITRCRHEASERSRTGSGDETTGRNVARDGPSGSPGFRRRRSSALAAGLMQRRWKTRFEHEGFEGLIPQFHTTLAGSPRCQVFVARHWVI
jgi:hypothetical protein